MSCRVPLSCLPFSLPRDEAHTQLSVSARLTGLQALGRARAAPPGSLSCDKHLVCSARVGSVVFFSPLRCLHSFPWRLWWSSRFATCDKCQKLFVIPKEKKKQQNVNMWLSSIDAAVRRAHRCVAQEIKTERWFMWVSFRTDIERIVFLRRFWYKRWREGWPHRFLQAFKKQEISICYLICLHRWHLEQQTERWPSNVEIVVS